MIQISLTKSKEISNNITTASNLMQQHTTMMTLIYHDEHKFFRQPIYQSIHHALNFHFLMTMVVIDAILIYISSSTFNTVLLVFVDVVCLLSGNDRRTTSKTLTAP